MSVVAAAIVGSVVVGSVASSMAASKASKASKRAAETQASADVYAADLQKSMYDEQVDIQEPFRQTGSTAMSAMERSVYGNDYIDNQLNTQRAVLQEAATVKASAGNALYRAQHTGDESMPIEDYNILEAASQKADREYEIQQGLYDDLKITAAKGITPTSETMGEEEQGVYNRLSEFTEGSMEDMANNPYYQFQQQQAKKGIETNLAARGLQSSRAGLNMLSDAEQKLTANMVNDRYAKLTNQYNTLTSQDNSQYNRLAGLANIGVGAAAAQTGSAQAYGTQASQAASDAGTSQANALLNQGQIKANKYNQIGGMVQNAIGAGAKSYL